MAKSVSTMNQSRRCSSALGVGSGAFKPPISPSPAPVQQSNSAFEQLKKRTRDPQTVRQTMKRAKISLCNSSETTAESRLLDQRMKTLMSAMDVRERLGDPITKEELPDDLLKLVYNVKDYV